MQDSLRRSQTTRPHTHGILSLSVSKAPHACVCVESPYRQLMTNRIGAGRDTHISTTMKATFQGFGYDQSNIPTVLTGFYQVQDLLGQPIDFPTIYPTGYVGGESFAQLRALCDTAFLVYATSKSYGMTQADIEGPTDGFAPLVARSFSIPTRAVNTAYQPSATRDTMVNASVSITSTISLTSGQTGAVSLQYADNNTFTTNLVTVQSFSNGNTGSLTLGLNLSQIITAALTGIIPAGKYYRLLTTNTTGTPTYGTPVVQEVLL